MLWSSPNIWTLQHEAAVFANSFRCSPATLKKNDEIIKINKVLGVFTSLFRLDLILCLTSNFVCKNTANFPLRSSKHKKRWWCVLYLKKGRKKILLKRFFGLNFFKICFFVYSVDCRGLKVLEKKSKWKWSKFRSISYSYD